MSFAYCGCGGYVRSLCKKEAPFRVQLLRGKASLSQKKSRL